MKKLVKIHGTPYEMGLEYGKQCKKEILKSFSVCYKYGAMSLTKGFRNGHPKLMYIIPTFFTYKRKKNKLQNIAKKFEEPIKKHAPEMIEEMKGIANGAEVDYQDILYLNAFPEIVVACSVWVSTGKASRNGEILLGMNTDELKQASKAQIILSTEPKDGYKFIGTAFAGVLSPYQGMNEKGLAIANMLLNLKKPDIQPIGMPTFIMLKMILSKCANVDEALELFKKLPNLVCPSAFFFADKIKSARIENGVKEYDITIIKDNAIGCCQRPLSEKMKKYDITSEIHPRMTVNAIPRTKRMLELLKYHYGNFDEQVMMDIARDHGEGETLGKGICQHGFSESTINSFIAKPKELKMWMCNGNPCNNKYEEIRISNASSK